MTHSSVRAGSSEGPAEGEPRFAQQILWRVRLPIAVPVIMAGIRQATVLNVAIATIGAAIASGGLGTPIFHAIGRSELTALDNLIRDWRTNGGDKSRNEYQDALAAKPAAARPSLAAA